DRRFAIGDDEKQVPRGGGQALTQALLHRRGQKLFDRRRELLRFDLDPRQPLGRESLNLLRQLIELLAAELVGSPFRIESADLAARLENTAEDFELRLRREVTDLDDFKLVTQV